MSSGEDAFDIEWLAEDPLGREIRMRKSIIEARESVGKHTGGEYLSADKVKAVITDPQRIDLTQKSPRHCEIYYADNQGSEYKHSRVVVQFDEKYGTPISWSCYKDHVSFMDVIYEKPREEL